MKKNKKGFTLIELLAVIVILGIILTIVVSNVVKYIKQARTGSYVDAYKVLVKDMQTQLLAKEVETGSSSLTTCDDAPDSNNKCSTAYSGLYKSDNISLTITVDTNSGTYTIKATPTTTGSFKNIDLTNTKEKDFSISKDKKTLSSKMKSDGTVSASNNSENKSES